MTQEKITEHAKSAALTFGTTIMLELSLAFDSIESFGDITPALLTGVLFTATRAALRLMVRFGK